MANKLPEAIFSFVPQLGINARDILSDLISNEQFIMFAKQYPNEELQLNCKLKNNKIGKENMYEYYHKVVLGVAVMYFDNAGWAPVDPVKADCLLKNECAKIEVYNKKTNELRIIVEDKANMTKDRLWKYINDCILFLQEEGYTVPESIQYTHPGYKLVNRFKKT